MADFVKRVMDLVSRPGYEPTTPKKLARYLELDDESYREFRVAVKGLVREGRLAQAKDKTLGLPSNRGLVIGTFRRTAKGFGFVRPLKATDRSRDVYIPADATKDASTGDEV